MRVKQKIFSSVVALSCVGVLYIAYAGNGGFRYRSRFFEIPSPVPVPDSPNLKYPMKEREGDFATDNELIAFPFHHLPHFWFL